MKWRWAIILGFFLILTGAFASTCVEIFAGNELFQTEDTLFKVLGENSVNKLRAQRSERVPGIPIRSIEQHTISWMKQVMGAYTRTEHFNLLSLEKKKSIRNLQKIKRYVDYWKKKYIVKL
jgi:hypothetical protein